MTKLRGSRAARWKLTEPVRLYVYTFGFLLIGFALFVDDALPAMGEPLAALCAALGLVLGAEAARASVWSPRGVLREAGKLARLQDIDRAAGV